MNEDRTQVGRSQRPEPVAEVDSSRAPVMLAPGHRLAFLRIDGRTGGEEGLAVWVETLPALAFASVGYFVREKGRPAQELESERAWEPVALDVELGRLLPIREVESTLDARFGRLLLPGQAYSRELAIRDAQTFFDELTSDMPVYLSEWGGGAAQAMEVGA